VRFFRRAALPRPAIAGLKLAPGERVLAHAPDDTGGVVAATERCLVLPVPDADPLRLPWEQVAKATWEDGQLLVTEVGDAAGPGPLHRLRLSDPGLLPETVRERVSASIVISRHVRLAGKAGVLLAARRRPGSNQVTWTLTFDPGVDHADPAVLARAKAELARLRAETVS